MDDFEFSVEISEHDWDCFIQECRECVVFSPALARVDDSGMSDMDELGAVLADRVVKGGHTAGLLEVDRFVPDRSPLVPPDGPPLVPPDGPPDREGSPVEHYPTRHTGGGMESVLSGSEEDIHLASVNAFFERMRSLAGAATATEPSQEGAREHNEALWGKQGQRGDGPQASNSAEFIPKINALPARGATATGREATQTASGTPAELTRRTTGTNDVPDSAAGASHVQQNQNESCVELAIAEEAAASTAADVRRLSVSQGSLEANVCSDTAVMPRMCEHANSVKQRDEGTALTAPYQTLSTETPSSQEETAQDRLGEGKHLHKLLADPQPQSPKWSPSPSTKKKRRKKRRVSSEPFESAHTYERQFLANWSDSEEERYSHGKGLDQPLSQDSIACITDTERTACSAAPLPRYSDFFQSTAASNLLLRISSMGNSFKPLSPSIPLNNSQYQNMPARSGPSERLVVANSHANGGICTVLPAPADGTNVPTHLQTKPVALSRSPHTAVLFTTSDMSGGTGCGNSAGCSTCKREQLLQPSDETRSLRNQGRLRQTTPESCPAEVISVAHSVLPCQMSDLCDLEANQNDQLSTTKAWLAGATENSGRDTLTLGQRELKGDGLDIAQYRAAYENATCPLATTGADMQELSTNKTQHHLNTELSSARNNNLFHDPSIDLTLETSNSSPNTMHQVKYFHHQLSKIDVVSENNSFLGIAQSTPLHSDELITFTSNIEVRPELTTSQDMLKSQTVASLSKTNIMGKACSSHGSNDVSSHTLVADQNNQGKSKPIHTVSEHRFDDGSNTEEHSAQAQKAPDPKHMAFTMSSFWSEMEKLTIKDILSLRMDSNTAPSSYLSPLPEGEESENSDARDSGYFTYTEMPNSSNATGEMSGIPDSSSLNPPGIVTDGSTHSANVLWGSQSDLGSGMYPQNTLLSSVRDSPLPNSSDDKYGRKIYKNVSVRNLQALNSESFGNLWKGRDLPTVIPQEGKLEEDYLADGQEPRRDSGLASFSPSSSADESTTGIYRLSLTDIFQYVFGGTQSKSNPSAEENMTTYTYTDGQSVPETYDHFFSDFDTGSLFYPLTESSDKSTDELVPLFSYPRSVNKNMQYPEAYEHFFASSSSDESSVESDEEGNETCRGPIRVVTRFSPKTSDTRVTTDLYENFFSDGDVKQNFFWKNTFSLRNVRLSDFMSQEQRSNSFIFVPVKHSGPSLPDMTIQSVNALLYQHKPFPNSVLFSLEDRIPRNLVEQRFSYDDLQTAISNPRLDAPLLPLRQSDMCLVCIAFASWVLKTTNPQVGDAWKAVLLANVSALSAIGYLRKYVRAKATTDQRALNLSAPI